jgi:hypothetical protein
MRGVGGMQAGVGDGVVEVAEDVVFGVEVSEGADGA